jgi:hypothetical protein
LHEAHRKVSVMASGTLALAGWSVYKKEHGFTLG